MESKLSKVETPVEGASSESSFKNVNSKLLTQKLKELQVVEAKVEKGKELQEESADISMKNTSVVFDNRFTRMKLKKEVLVRTDKGFLEFFNLNSHLTMNECWEKETIPGKRDRLHNRSNIDINPK